MFNPPPWTLCVGATLHNSGSSTKDSSFCGVALIASYHDEEAEDIASSHILVLDYCSKAGMSIVSIGSNGAATELLAL